jgi:hypothetical protein
MKTVINLSSDHSAIMYTKEVLQVPPPVLETYEQLMQEYLAGSTEKKAMLDLIGDLKFPVALQVDSITIMALGSYSITGDQVIKLNAAELQMLKDNLDFLLEPYATRKSCLAYFHPIPTEMPMH